MTIQQADGVLQKNTIITKNYDTILLENFIHKYEKMPEVSKENSENLHPENN